MTKDKPTCESVLLEHFRANPLTWIKKVECYAIAEDWSPETVGRALRLLAEDPTSGIEVDYYPAKRTKAKLAMYCMGTPTKPFTRWEEITKDDGTRVMIPVTIIR